MSPPNPQRTLKKKRKMLSIDIKKYIYFQLKVCPCCQYTTMQCKAMQYNSLFTFPFLHIIAMFYIFRKKKETKLDSFKKC